MAVVSIFWVAILSNLTHICSCYTVGHEHVYHVATDHHQQQLSAQYAHALGRCPRDSRH